MLHQFCYLGKKRHYIYPITADPCYKQLQFLLCDILGDYWKQRNCFKKTASKIIKQCGTHKKYRVYLKRWERYCCGRKMDAISCNVSEGVNFLAELYDTGLSYSSMDTARSALSNVMQLQTWTDFGSNALVS